MGAGHWKKRKRRVVSWLAKVILITSSWPYQEVPVSLPMWPWADPSWPSSSLLLGSYRSDLLTGVSSGSYQIPEGETCFRKLWNNKKLLTIDLKSIWWGNRTQNRNIPQEAEGQIYTPHCCFCHCIHFPILIVCLHLNSSYRLRPQPCAVRQFINNKTSLHLWTASLCQVLCICSFNPPINPLGLIWLYPFHRQGSWCFLGSHSSQVLIRFKLIYWIQTKMFFLILWGC